MDGLLPISLRLRQKQGVEVFPAFDRSGEMVLERTNEWRAHERRSTIEAVDFLGVQGAKGSLAGDDFEPLMAGIATAASDADQVLPYR